jgi:acetyl esterase
MVYMHGGGFIVGSLDQFESTMRLLAEHSGAQVYCVDYKLAPEYQWPVQMEEGEAVVRWLFKNAAERGVDPNRIALSGDSAGGNMTCTISLKLRDEKGPRLALQMPLYPEAAMPFNTRQASRIVPAPTWIRREFCCLCGACFHKVRTTRNLRSLR